MNRRARTSGGVSTKAAGPTRRSRVKGGCRETDKAVIRPTPEDLFPTGAGGKFGAVVNELGVSVLNGAIALLGPEML